MGCNGVYKAGWFSKFPQRFIFFETKKSRGDKTDKIRKIYNDYNETTTERTIMSYITRIRHARRQAAYSRAWQRQDWDAVLAPYCLTK